MYVYSIFYYMKQFVIIISFLLLSSAINVQAQNQESNTATIFQLKGVVRESDTDKPVARVNIEIVNGAYTTTNIAGEFSISAKIGDEIVFKSDNFKTVYYTIKDRQKIAVMVEKETPLSFKKSKSISKTEMGVDLFKTYIDSASYFSKKDAEKSIEFVTKALESVSAKKASNTQNATAFEMLGDINMYWKQYDLAVSNYKRTISYFPRRKTQATLDVYIKLAQAYKLNSNYQESITAFNRLLKERLSNYQKIEIYEGLGDVYKETNDINNSVTYYEKGLEVANSHQILPKITDLNSKIADVYAQSGSFEQANIYYDNSLNLAEQENKKRAATEKSKVADFYNQSQDFEKEIQLREETLEDIEEFEDADDMEDEISQTLTPQRQNYKIANAYASQGKSEEAIPFLQKSIEEADKNQDLVVEKDATRKLSEIYKDLGEFDKAAESYQNYVKLVDELYVIKEQEISQAARFRREIAFKQNRITSLENERLINENRYQLAQENEELTQKNIQVQQWIIITLIIIALLLVTAAFIQFRSIKQQKLANNLLALKSLRTQMNPHFIFNALNSVNSFIASNDERAANKYLSEFSQLMRSVLENSELK